MYSTFYKKKHHQSYFDPDKAFHVEAYVQWGMKTQNDYLRKPMKSLKYMYIYTTYKFSYMYIKAGKKQECNTACQTIV